MLESRMVDERALEAGVDRRDRVAAAAQFLADALIDQHVGVDRDADGQHDAGDAGQRQRGVEQRQQAEDHGDVDGDRDIGEHAEQPIGHQHEDDDHDRTDIGCEFALLDRILAEPRPDGAFLDHRQWRRQRAGAQQDREIVGGLHGEIAGNLPGAAGDRFADHGRGNHLVVEHDRKRLPDILRRRLREFARSGGVEAEADDRLARALVEARLRVGQIAAGNQHLLLDDVGRFRRGRTHQHLGIGRHPARLRLVRRHGGIDHAEFHLGGLADQFLQPGRILQARHLHQDAIGALALDHRFDGAELVDAAFDDLDRLFDGLADALGDGGLRHAEPDQPAAGIADFERSAGRWSRAARRAAATIRAILASAVGKSLSLTRTSTLSGRVARPV